MSYTTIKSVWPGEKHEDLKELRNSHGSAPVVWDAMCQKYLGTKEFGYFTAIDDLWPKYKDESIPIHQRAVLMMTYDKIYVSKKDYKRAASDILRFLGDFPVKKEYVNHWPEIAKLFDSDPDIPAIGFRHTSVSEDLFQGEWDEEKEEYDQPDWEEFYDLYSELED